MPSRTIEPNRTVWRGPKTLEQQKLKWSFESEQQSVVVPFAGPYSVCVAKRPKVGGTLAGFTSTNMTITKVEIEEGDGETATMSVYLGATKAPDSDTSFAAIGEPIYELDFQELTKPLEQHPKCGILNPDRTEKEKLGKKRATWDDWADLEQDVDYIGVGPVQWDLATYQAKRQKGIENFQIVFPIVRRTLTFYRQPSGIGDGCFHQEYPPGEAEWPTEIGGHEVKYIKSTEKLRKQGRVRTLETEWIGAWDFDSDLYPGFT